MIPYADLERALAHWKAAQAQAAMGDAEAGAPPTAEDGGAGAQGAEKKKTSSSLDWSMDQAMGGAAAGGAVAAAVAGDTNEIPVDAVDSEPPTEPIDEAAPQQEASGGTGEINVDDIEEESPR